MLICLDREQRLIYLMGDIFHIDHNLGAEIFQISKENFRVKLSRARTELHNYMEYRCGLIKASNPCRCVKKAKVAVEKGIINTENRLFKLEYTDEIRIFVEENLEDYREMVDKVDKEYIDIYRKHPVRSEFDSSELTEKILEDEEVKRLLLQH